MFGGLSTRNPVGFAVVPDEIDCPWCDWSLDESFATNDTQKSRRALPRHLIECPEMPKASKYARRIRERRNESEE